MAGLKMQGSGGLHGLVSDTGSRRRGGGGACFFRIRSDGVKNEHWPRFDQTVFLVILSPNWRCARWHECFWTPTRTTAFFNHGAA